MNKNTRKKVKSQHKAQRAAGGFPKPAFKRKAKPFPRPNTEADLSIKAQCAMFYGTKN